jgi:hypothetical protein
MDSLVFVVIGHMRPGSGLPGPVAHDMPSRIQMPGGRFSSASVRCVHGDPMIPLGPWPGTAVDPLRVRRECTTTSATEVSTGPAMTV